MLELKKNIASENIVYLQYRREYLSGQIKYLGKNTSNTAIDADTTWEITKYKWDIYNDYKKETLTGSWDGRTALAWTI